MHGRQEMLRERRDGGIGIALEHGVHDRGVFGFDIAGFFGVAPDRKPPIAFALLVQHVAKAEQPWRAAGIHQRAVENAMPHHPFFIVMGRIVGIGVGNGAERRERPLHRSEPCLVAMLDRAPQRQPLDIDAGLRDVPEIGGRYRADAKAALVGGLHQPVGDQPRQRLAHRGEADGKLLGEPGDMQLLAGQQPGRQDVGAQPFLNGRRQASRPVVGQIVPKTQPDTAHGGGRLARLIRCRQSKIDFFCRHRLTAPFDADRRSRGTVECSSSGNQRDNAFAFA